MKGLIKFTTALLSGVLTFGLASTSFAAVISDRVVMDSVIYGHFDVLIPEGGDPEATAVFVGGSPIFGGDGWGLLNIFLTEPGTNIISDHLFSQQGATHSCDANGNGADCLFFSSDASLDPLIGTLCTFGPAFCLEETGDLQDVSFMVAAQNGGLGIFGGGTILLQSDVDEVPEPSALALIGMALLSLLSFGLIRRRSGI